jgi:hypothetical protein
MRITINVDTDSIDEREAIKYVSNVMADGKVSNDGKCYCYLTRYLNGVLVSADNTRSGNHTFSVRKEGG